MYLCEVTLLIPPRDVSNTIAYTIESLLDAIGAERWAAMQVTFRCNLTGEQITRLKDDAESSELLKEIRNTTGVTIIDIVSVDVLQ
jgi:hypothetical protein